MYTETKALHAQKTIAMFVALALLFLTTGFHLMMKTTHAANITNVSDTLSDSTPGAVSNHTIAFTLPNGMAIGDTITVSFPAQFTIPGAMDEGDLDLTDDTTEQTLGAAAGAGTWGVGIAGQDITLETPTDGGVGSSSVMVLEIGTNATSGGTGAELITNPTATTSSYEISITTSWDSGQTRVAVVDNVYVTANVNTSFTFTVQGTSTGTTINGSPTTTADNSTPTTLPFGTLVGGTSKLLGQDLFVQTNAANGFVVTVETTEPFDSSTGADIDTFTNGTDVTVPTGWANPSNQIGSEETYGHWGVTSDDDDFSATQDEWIAASTTPRAIFSHDSVADGATFDVGYTAVGYQVEITDLQEAADDYNTYLIYIATPTF